MLFSSIYFLTNFEIIHLFSAKEETGDNKDCKRVVNQLLNRYVATRTITKQESMCELGKLPMVICTEAIETLSISSAKFQEGESSGTTFVKKYKNREEQFQSMSLHQYFMKEKNTDGGKKTFKEVVPHYVGGSGQPKYPVNQRYARATLIQHYPWSKRNPLPPEEDYIPMFNDFIESNDCPASVKLAFERAKLRSYLEKRGIEEVMSPDQEESIPVNNVLDEDVFSAVNISGTLQEVSNTTEDTNMYGFNYGIHYDWGKRVIENVSFLFCLSNMSIGIFLKLIKNPFVYFRLLKTVLLG